jgi:protoporphyrin/coproporphyrin ferrochelatase
MTSQGRDDARWGVILLAHGAPERLEDIPAFLLSLRNGRPLPRAAVEEIVERYRLIGGGSPLTKLTQRQATALAARLGLPVYAGMRNWRPYIAEAVGQAARDGLERAVVVCLAPQNSRTSVGLYRRYLEEARDKLAPRLALDFIESWHDHPGLITALGDRVAAALDRLGAEAGEPVPVIFSAHSVPERTIREGDAYERQVRETARLVADALGLGSSRWSVAFQSQGMTPEPWIGPTVESEIDRRAAAGHRYLLVAPIGFVCDHVEILYDIDIGFRQYAGAKGVTLARSESLNDSPLFIQALAELVRSRAENTGILRSAPLRSE